MNESNNLPERLLVAYIDQDVKVGEGFEDWPLHLTVLPWFRTPLDYAINTLRKTSIDFNACDVAFGSKKLGRVALFGTEYDVPVREVEGATSIGVMHGMLLMSFHEFLEDKSFTGGRYNPHITIRKNHDPGEDYVFRVNKLSLVKYGKPTKTVVEIVDLAEE